MARLSPSWMPKWKQKYIKMKSNMGRNSVNGLGYIWDWFGGPLWDPRLSQNHFTNCYNFRPFNGRSPTAGNRSWEAGFAPVVGSSGCAGVNSVYK